MWNGGKLSRDRAETSVWAKQDFLASREEQHDDQLLTELLRCIKAVETAEVSARGNEVTSVARADRMLPTNA